MPFPRQCAAALAIALAAATPCALEAAERDLGTGYLLENVEVLDPAMGLKEARRYMVEHNEALGVKCRDCHDVRDFPSDVKPLKLIAREMMKMTRDINERWFPEAKEEVVTCYTCHQGARKPPIRMPSLEDLRGPGAKGDPPPTEPED